MTTYILVADSGQAKLYTLVEQSTAPELLEEIANPMGRLTPGELTTDRAGVQRNDMGGAHGLGGDKNPQRHAGDEFARQICAHLHKAHMAGKFSDLRIAAPPHFLGSLRAHLHQDCNAILSKTVNKDLVRSDVHKLMEYFD